MAAKNNLTMTSDVQVTAREIDFVTSFARNWQHLRDILGIMRPIKKQPGTVLKSKTASVTLAQSVGEGEEIPQLATYHYNGSLRRTMRASTSKSTRRRSLSRQSRNTAMMSQSRRPTKLSCMSFRPTSRTGSTTT